MASEFALSWPRLLTVEEFLQIDFGPELKAELDDGSIRMLAGGSRAHARVQMNLYRFLGNALRGSGCRPFGSDMGVRTKELALRYPDLTVDCGKVGDQPFDEVLGNPRVLLEILSPSTRDYDLRIKRAEYRQMVSVSTIAFVDPETGTLSTCQRVGGDWTETLFAATDLSMPELGIVVPHSEIFAED